MCFGWTLSTRVLVEHYPEMVAYSLALGTKPVQIEGRKEKVDQLFWIEDNTILEGV
jgi:hypothetical protein